MPLKKFVKEQVVAVRYSNGSFYKAIVLTAYKDGRVKIRFDGEDEEEGVYPNKDVFDFVIWSKKKNEKKSKDESKKPTNEVEKEIIDDDKSSGGRNGTMKQVGLAIGDEFNIEGLSETLDSDLDAMLGTGGSVETESAGIGTDVFEKAEAPVVEESEESVFQKETDDSVFQKETDDSVFEKKSVGDMLEYITNVKDMIKLVQEKKWHKTYTLGLTEKDTVAQLQEKIRDNVPAEELLVEKEITPPDEDSVFGSDKGTAGALLTETFDSGSVGSKDAPLIESPKDLDVSNTENWFSVGDDDDDRFSPLRSGTVRFWVPRGEKARIILITPKPFTYKEHRIRVDGQTKYVTCGGIHEGDRCALCEDKKRAYVAKAFFIIDTSEYYSKKHKKQMKNQIRFLVWKGISYEPFKQYVYNYFKGNVPVTMRGLQLVVGRTTGDQAPAQGDIFLIEGVVKKDLFKGDYDKTVADVQKEVRPYEFSVIQKKIPSIEEEPTYDN